jgi:hypothetical protein
MWSAIAKWLVAITGLFAVGIASTLVLVGDGLSDLKSEKQPVARDALLNARLGCSDHPLSRVLHLRMRVALVEPQRESCLAVGEHPRRSYRVIIETYTLFMIRTGTVSVVCGSGVDCRE